MPYRLLISYFNCSCNDHLRLHSLGKLLSLKYRYVAFRLRWPQAAMISCFLSFVLAMLSSVKNILLPDGTYEADTSIGSDNPAFIAGIGVIGIIDLPTYMTFPLPLVVGFSDSFL